MIRIDRGRINLLFSTAAFTISSAGSVLLHIVLAVAIYAKTGSGLMTSLFISLQWLPALLVVLYRSDWDHGMNPRMRWYVLDLLSASLTLPILLFVTEANYLPVMVLLLARGLVDHVNRINKTVAARALFPKAKSTHYASFLQSGYHLGIGVAAVAGVLLAQSVEIKFVVVLDALTFVVSAILIYFTRCIEDDHAVNVPVSRESLGRRIAEYRDALNNDRRLFICAMLPPLTATFFQGSYSVLQPIFPIHKLGLDSSAVSTSYVLVSVAVVIGSSSFSLFCKVYRLFERPFLQTKFLVTTLSLACAMLYVCTVWVRSPILSAVLFTLMIIVFEFIWMIGYSGIVVFAPKGQLGSVFGISFAIGCFLASMLATAVGMLIDYFESDFVQLVQLLMALFLSIVAFLMGSSKPAIRVH